MISQLILNDIHNIKLKECIYFRYLVCTPYSIPPYPSLSPSKAKETSSVLYIPNIPKMTVIYFPPPTIYPPKLRKTRTIYSAFYINTANATLRPTMVTKPPLCAIKDSAPLVITSGCGDDEFVVDAPPL